MLFPNKTIWLECYSIKIKYAILQHYVGIYELRTTAENFPKTGTYVVKLALKPAIYATKIILARTNLTMFYYLHC